MQFILGQCHAAITQYPGVVATLFLAGLVGGVTHCAGMCGPFVASQVMSRAEHAPSLGRLRGASLLPYHLGRMTTYMMLGVVAALLSRQIMGTPLQQGVSVVFLSLAGLIFVASALPQVRQWLFRFRSLEFITGNSSRLGKALGRMAHPFWGNPTGAKGYMLGVLLGFLPCGLVFAALMVVSTTGSPLTAALAMLVFTVGTIPALFLVGLGSECAYRRWPVAMQTVARGVMVLNGFSLFILAGKLVF